MTSTSRKIIAATAVAGTLLVGGITVASAQSTTSSQPTTTANPVSPATPANPTRPDRSARLQETLKPLVAAGTITQAQADAVVKALVSAQPQPGMGGMGGRGGRHGGFGRGGYGRAGRSALAGTVATALGITPEELQTKLQSGSTIAQIAAARGVPVQKVIDAVVNAVKTANPGVNVADVTTRVTAMVNDQRPTHAAKTGAPATSATPTAAATATA
jgi:hypothetical protein